MDTGIIEITFEIGLAILYKATLSKVDNIPSIIESTHPRNEKEIAKKDSANPVLRYSFIMG